jgi:hypothetical protein
MRLPKRDNARLLIAVIGASGAVAVGALTIAIGQQQAGSDMVVSSGSSTASGPSSTTTTPMIAVPLLKGPAALPPEEQAPAAP